MKKTILVLLTILIGVQYLNAQVKCFAGDTLKLHLQTPELYNSIQWQKSKNNIEWINVQNANDSVCTSIIDTTNTNKWYYRAQITINNCIHYSENTEINLYSNVNQLSLGSVYGGGIIFYLFEQDSGLVVTPVNQSIGIQWFNNDLYNIAETTSSDFGSGLTNTNKIVELLGDGNYAAKLCANLVLNGYSDWYLPSLPELQELYNKRNSIGYTNQTFYFSFSDEFYWSSSTQGNNNAWTYHLKYGQSGFNNNANYHVRAIRTFKQSPQSFSQNVNFIFLPTVANAGSDLSIMKGETDTLTASGGFTFLWNTGDTTTSITVSPTQTTTYTVTVTDGACTASDEVVVNVTTPACTQVISSGAGNYIVSSGETYCVPVDGTFSGSIQVSTGGTLVLCQKGNFTGSIMINPGGTLRWNSSNTFLVGSFLNFGTSDDSPSNCFTCTSIMVSVDTTICDGNTYMVAGNLYTSTGIYIDTLTSSTGCDSIITTHLTVQPIPAITLTEDHSIISGNTTALTAAGGLDYLWSTGQTIESISVAPLQTTTFVVTVSDGQCSGTDHVVVSVIKYPDGINKVFCTNDSVTLTVDVSSQTFDSLVWLKGTLYTEVIQKTPIITLTDTGTTALIYYYRGFASDTVFYILVSQACTSTTNLILNYNQYGYANGYQLQETSKVPSDYQAQVGDIITINIAGVSDYDITDLKVGIVDTRQEAMWWTQLSVFPTLSEYIVAGEPFDLSVQIMIYGDAVGAGPDFQKIVFEAISAAAGGTFGSKVTLSLTKYIVEITENNVIIPTNPCNCSAWVEPQLWNGSEPITLYVDFNYTNINTVQGYQDLYLWTWIMDCPTGDCSNGTWIQTPTDINNGSWNLSNEAYKMQYYDGNIYSYTISNPIDFYALTSAELYQYYIGLLAKAKDGTGDLKTEDLYVKLDLATEINSKDFSQTFSLFPNPAANSITLQTNADTEIHIIEITNSLGQTVYQQQIPSKNSQEQIDISLLVNGVYFAKMYTATGVVVKMFVKE